MNEVTASGFCSAQLASKVAEMKCKVDLTEVDVWAYSTGLECPAFSKQTPLSRISKEPRTDKNKVIPYFNVLSPKHWHWRPLVKSLPLI